MLDASGVAVGAQRGDDVDGLAAGEIRLETHVAGHARDSSVQRDCISPRIAAEHVRTAAFGANQTEQHTDRGRLARTVGAEKDVHRARRNGEVEAVGRGRLADSLR